MLDFLFGWWGLALVGVAVGYLTLPTSLEYLANKKRERRVAEFVLAQNKEPSSVKADLQDRVNAGSSSSSKLEPKRIVAIVNPHGGSKKALGIFQRIFEPMAKACCLKVDLHQTTCAGHAISISRDAANNEKVGLVVCFSGDGMVHEAIQGIMEASGKAGRMDTAVAIMPCGSSNGLAMSLYGSVDPFECAAKILGPDCQARSSSIVSLQTLGSGSGSAQPSFDIMGVSQAVVGDANYICEGKLRWMNNLPAGAAIKDLIAAVYLILLMRQYWVHVSMRCLPLSEDELSGHRYRDPTKIKGVKRLTSPPKGASSETEGEWFSLEDGWTWCETANVSHIAQDCQPAPGLLPSDPHMDLVLSRDHTRKQLAVSFLRSEHGTHVHDEWFHLFKVAEIVFTPRNPKHDYYMSGELVGEQGKPASCRCLPNRGSFWF